MYLLIILLPLFSSIISLLFGFLIGRKGAAFLTILSMFICFILINIIFYEVGFNACPTTFKIATWFDCQYLHIDWGFLFDSLSVSLIYIVCFISFLVHIYSYEYMNTDPHLPRFMAFLSLFTFFMLILVSADNFLQMFVGWEGVGLASYLLINFWFTRIQANKAAIKAMLINRIGDFFLALGIFGIYYTYKSIDYAVVFNLIHLNYNTVFISIFNNNIPFIEFLSLCLFLGAMGKSAQLGLHTWLPDAMEGPTPVSALIHAATMVTAGVFLIARCSFLFEYSSNVLILIAIIGSLTAFIAGSIGLMQNDLKKVIAYSTCSQLGYMIFACGLSGYTFGIFHLINHAFFKALLFLGAGAIIHSLQDEQDIRRMGGLKNVLPFTYAIMLIGSLSLMGFPFFTGFYSKDAILEIAYASYSNVGFFCYILGSFAAFLTAFYSIRVLYLSFLDNSKGFKPVILNIHEATPLITFVLFILAIPSIFFGFYFKDMFIGMGTDFWGTSIYINFQNSKLIDAEFIPHFYKIFPVTFALLGAYTSYIIYSKYSLSFHYLIIKYKYLRLIYTFFNKKYFFDKLYNELLVQMLLNFSFHYSYKLIDKFIIEIFGPTGLYNFSIAVSPLIRQFHSGLLNIYILCFLSGIIISFFI